MTRIPPRLKHRRSFMIETFTLDNGLRIVHEHMPSFRSVSFGVWVRVGSILENSRINGYSHFMEHMSFKDTQNRTAREIAETMDAVGGHMNAGTGKMTTSYYAKVIDDDLPLAFEVISDMLVNPALKEEDISREKGVVIEEIAMVEDQPDDTVFDILAGALYGPEGAGRTVLGPEEVINGVDQKALRAFRDTYYGPRNAVISTAGGVDIGHVRALAEKYFGAWRGADRADYPGQRLIMERCAAKDKETEQTHICLGYEGLPLGSPKRYAASVMNNILGGSVSSRLFQRIREELGLAYTVYSGSTSFPGCGDFTVYAAAGAKNIPKVYEEIRGIIASLCRDGFTDKEFNYAKAQLKSNAILGMESSYSRMSGNGTRMALLDTFEEPDEIIGKMDAVTREDVMEQLDCLRHSKETVALVGENASNLIAELAK